MPSILVACVVVAVAAATPPPTSIEVATASELLAAIGPDRTIQLAAGDFDLGALAHTPTAHVRWDETTVPESLVVHDVDNLRIVGPSEGTARVYTSSAVILQFQKTHGLELRRITLGQPAKLRRFDEADDADMLRGPSISDSREVTIEDVRTLATGCSALSLRGVDDARISRFEDGGCSGVEVSEGRGLRIDDAHVRSPIVIYGAKGGTLTHVTVETDAGAGAGIASAVQASFGAEITLDHVRLVDAVTGKVRSQVDHGAAPVIPSAPAAEDPAAVGFVLRRSGREGSDPGDPEYGIRLTLEDGREPFSDVKAGSGWGLNPASMRVRRLGDRDAPISIVWSDFVQGSGSFQSTFYQVVGPGPNDGILLQGVRSNSGHEGFGNGSSGEIYFGFEGGFLTVRGHGSGFTTPNDGTDAAFRREWAYVSESIYRFRNGQLEAFRFEEYVRVEPDGDLAELATDGYRPVWPHRDGSQPRPGEWLKRVIPVDDGEKKYPRITALVAEGGG